MGQMILLVEGPEDRAVVYHLLNRHALPLAERSIEIQNGNGSNNILQSLSVRLRAMSNEEPPARLGIVLDADSDLSSRWQAIRNRLSDDRIGYQSVPLIPDPAGTLIVEEGLPIVGIWLMPDNQLPGEIEDFARRLVAPDDRLWPRAEEAVGAIPLADRRFPPHDLMKATIHTWLAWQEEPGRPMGQAITKRYLDHNAPQAQQFVEWVRRLFDLP
jgi:hypothetical protein